jgi:hypothetical protein
MNQPDHRFYLNTTKFQERENKTLTKNTIFSDMTPYGLVDVYISEESAAFIFVIEK